MTGKCLRACENKPYHSNMKNMNYCPNCGAKMIGEDDE